jgi:hypothetical protein
MWFHKNTHRPVASENVEDMKSRPRWQEDFEWVDVTKEWQHEDRQVIILGQSDTEKLLTTDIQPYTTLQSYLEGMAMAEAQKRYENTPHLYAHLTMLQATTWEVEANRHMLNYTQRFTAYYSKATPGLSTEPVDFPTTPAAAEETPAPPPQVLTKPSAGKPSISLTVRRSARMMKAGRSAAKHARR